MNFHQHNLLAGCYVTLYIRYTERPGQLNLGSLRANYRRPSSTLLGNLCTISKGANPIKQIDCAALFWDKNKEAFSPMTVQIKQMRQLSLYRISELKRHTTWTCVN